MLFVIDVGNTHTVVGIFEGGSLVADWRIQTHDGRTADEHGSMFQDLLEAGAVDPDRLEDALMSSVVPPMERTLADAVREYLGLELSVVGRDVEAPMPVRVAHPSEVGADRLVNAYAAWNQLPEAQIVVDFGTATTFDAISAGGEYAGGAIAPGVTISSEALFETASKLPRVELARPESVIGKTTVDSIQSGLVYGYIGQVREIVTRVSDELGEVERVVATGGLAEILAPEMDLVDSIDARLTLHGLRDLHAWANR
jgi:type III pantothenate kinase